MSEVELSGKELEKLRIKIIDAMYNMDYENSQDTPKGVAKQKEIIEKINEHPEVLRVQTKRWGHRTIGISAVWFGSFYVAMRALEDAEACELQDDDGDDVYQYIKNNNSFRERMVNSQEYKDLVARLESEVAEFDEYEDMSEYDSIME